MRNRSGKKRWQVVVVSDMVLPKGENLGEVWASSASEAVREIAYERDWNALWRGQEFQAREVGGQWTNILIEKTVKLRG
jgi:hypothetical protein